jgi:hypothetical protein
VVEWCCAHGQRYQSAGRSLLWGCVSRGQLMMTFTSSATETASHVLPNSHFTSTIVTAITSRNLPYLSPSLSRAATCREQLGACGYVA